ncbi:hypothetical protein H0G86_001476 [Trichoderma simmonsii]|uniref:Uncharacterized protein n=1 Tax=Trichoderma simmonsii TaxID=1491479 RepID=A0A8G0PB85_9HYPO|nr:hypothetical protein H0G86_001476 [Trichoderma simmonsii]
MSWKTERNPRDSDPILYSVSSNNVLRFLRDPDFVPAFPSAVSAGEAVPVSYTRVAEPGPEASLNIL